jgi:hypothetical protein
MNPNRTGATGGQQTRTAIERIDEHLRRNSRFSDTQKLNMIRRRLFGRLPEDRDLSSIQVVPLKSAENPGFPKKMEFDTLPNPLPDRGGEGIRLNPGESGL